MAHLHGQHLACLQGQATGQAPTGPEHPAGTNLNQKSFALDLLLQAHSDVATSQHSVAQMHKLMMYIADAIRTCTSGRVCPPCAALG